MHATRKMKVMCVYYVSERIEPEFFINYYPIIILLFKVIDYNIWMERSAFMALPSNNLALANEMNAMVKFEHIDVYTCKCRLYFILGSHYYYYYYYKWQMNRMRERLRFNWNDKRHIHHFDSLNPNKTKPNQNQFPYWGKRRRRNTEKRHSHSSQFQTEMDLFILGFRMVFAFDVVRLLFPVF